MGFKFGTPVLRPAFGARAGGDPWQRRMYDDRSRFCFHFGRKLRLDKVFDGVADALRIFMLSAWRIRIIGSSTQYEFLLIAITDGSYFDDIVTIFISS
jgi:hypothetical protein